MRRVALGKKRECRWLLDLESVASLAILAPNREGRFWEEKSGLVPR